MNIHIEYLENVSIPGISYGFITRSIPNCSYKFIVGDENGLSLCSHNINKIAELIGPNNSFTNQIHSNVVIEVNGSSNPADLAKADGQVTTVKNLNLWVLTADCVPILFYDLKTGVIGSCHAGWRGAFSNIIRNTVQKMLEFGASTDNITAIIGPCIRQESYEVGPEFYDNFTSESHDYGVYFLPKNGKYMFDIAGFIHMKLKNSGISKIYDSGYNTYTNPEKWFSFRRFTHNPSEQYGSIVSFIRLEGK